MITGAAGLYVHVSIILYFNSFVKACLHGYSYAIAILECESLTTSNTNALRN